MLTQKKKILLRRVLLLELFIVLYAVIWFPSASGFSSYMVRPLHIVARSPLSMSALHGPLRTSARVSKGLVRDVVHTYMQALLKGHYNEMWSLLHPAMQAKWPNESAFAKFWQRRFQDFDLRGFTLGADVQDLAQWSDPETMVQYTSVEKMSVSLQLEPQVSPSMLARLVPEDQHPSQLFRNLPFIVKPYVNVATGEESWCVLNGGPADLEAPILPPLHPLERTVQVPILMYHHVVSEASSNPGSDFYVLWVVTPEDFKAQMDYLDKHGYHTITFNQLFNALYYGGPLPKKPIILTFDDGDSDHYTTIYPVLLRHHFSGMFYIPSGWVGSWGHMTWPQLREMLAHGMQMGSHTVRHADLAKLMDISEPIVQEELLQAKDDLQTNLGIPIQQFCYPYGNPFQRGVEWQQVRIMQLLAQDSYVGATTAFWNSGITQMSSKPYALLRISVFGSDSFSTFVSKLPWI